MAPEDTAADEGIPLIEDEPNHLATIIHSEDTVAEPNHPTIIFNSEESPQLVHDQANTVDEIDPDLEAAIAFSLMADVDAEMVDADEESKKVEENLADKILPYGRHENAQKIIMDFYSLWEENFLNLAIFTKYNSNDDMGVFDRTQLAKYRNEITADFDKLHAAVNETVFQRTLFKMASHMLWMHNICYYKTGYAHLLPSRCESIDSLFNKHNLTQTMVALMLEKHSDICEKYTNVWNFIASGQNHNKLIDDRSLNRGYEFAISTSIEKLASLISPEGAVFKHGFGCSTSADYRYKLRINKAKDSLIAQDRNLFFMANQACFQRKLPETASAILPTINSFCCVLKFSEKDVYKLQESFRKVYEERDKKARLAFHK